MKYGVTVAIVFSALCFSAPSYAEEDAGFSYHGLRLGMNEKQLAESFPEFKCESDQSSSELRRCNAKFDTSKRPGVFEQLRGGGINTLLTFRNDRLVNISIPFFRELFEPGSLLFVQHYGKPQMTRKLIKNSQGNEKENTTLLWAQGAESILYWKIDEDRFNKENVDNQSRILFLLKE